MSYASFANDVLLEMISLSVWNKFSKPDSLIRKINRGYRRGLQQVGINQYGTDRILLGKETADKVNPRVYNKIKGVKAIMGEKVPGDKRLYKRMVMA